MTKDMKKVFEFKKGEQCWYEHHFVGFLFIAARTKDYEILDYEPMRANVKILRDFAITVTLKLPQQG